MSCEQNIHQSEQRAVRECYFSSSVLSNQPVSINSRLVECTEGRFICWTLALAKL